MVVSIRMTEEEAHALLAAIEIFICSPTTWTERAARVRIRLIAAMKSFGLEKEAA